MDTKKVLWALLVLFIVCGFFGNDIVAQEKKPAKDSKATDERDRVEILIEQLKDKDKDVRISAIRSLAETKDPRVVEPLISLLKDKDAEIRWKSAVALGEQFKDVRAVEPLIVALKYKDKSVRENAAGSLGKINDPRAIPHLIEALKDKHHDVRRNVAIVLGWMQDARAVEPLIAALRDSDAGVREKADEAIKRITNKTVDCDGYNEAVLSEEIKEKITGYLFTGKAVYKTISADQTRVTSPEEIEDRGSLWWERETYTASFTYTYPIFDLPELAEINESWAIAAKDATKGFLTCSGDGHFQGYRFGGSIGVALTLFSPHLISLSIEDTDFQDPTHGVGRLSYSMYSGLIYGKSKTGDSFKEIGLADLLGKDCLRLLDKAIYDTLKRTYKEFYEDVADENYPNGRGLAISGFHGLDSGGVIFAMNGTGIGLPNAAGDACAHIPYKSFSKCIPQNSPLRSVMR